MIQTQKKATQGFAKSKIVTIPYSQLKNQVDEGSQMKYLPGLGPKKRASSISQPQSPNPQIEFVQEPRLLTTAKQHMLQYHPQQMSEAELSNILGMTSFMCSRQVTPINPFVSNQRRKTIAKARLNSINGQLFDIVSNPEQNVHGLHTKYKNPQFRLYDNILGQCQAVFHHVFQRHRTVSSKLIQSWKDCLQHEDKSQIFIPIQDGKINIPYTHPRVYALNQLEKGFKQIYGTGKNRCLRAGEESSIIASIERYLAICLKDPMKIARKDFDIVSTVLQDCKLQQLQTYPMCLKQTEAHLKIMATRWKYSGQIDAKDKVMEVALAVGKGNFIDLNKRSILSSYLFKHSNAEQIQ